jgi:hypothetical protein
MTNLDLLSGHITQAELARQLGKRPSTLERWRRKRIGPAVTYNGKTPIYKIASVQAWLQSREVDPARKRRWLR